MIIVIVVVVVVGLPNEKLLMMIFILLSFYLNWIGLNSNGDVSKNYSNDELKIN